MDLDMDIDNDSDEDFDPCDKELIEGYLMNKISNRPVDQYQLTIFKMWILLSILLKTSQGRKNNTLYFFTPRHRHFPLALRRVRGAGEGGYWKISGRTSKIYGKDGNVGYKKPFNFYRGRPGRDEKTDWIMHEYIVQRGSGLVADNMVLCKIAEDDAESRRNYKSVRDLLKRLKM
ncbi:hypothetical protein IFM89_003577 [Coptis chinensis]|uniref:NAC domain-containing protein n=1 Tax=Coptis chinensis TaxID=261450 RepID=A0A835I2I1_9MAGN|nr:hypothetical protein IFM89_003577 [Coptis chinensis]